MEETKGDDDEDNDDDDDDDDDDGEQKLEEEEDRLLGNVTRNTTHRQGPVQTRLRRKTARRT